MYVIYSSNEEVIVCVSETEPETIKQFFTESDRDIRDIDDYDRIISDDIAVCITCCLRAE